MIKTLIAGFILCCASLHSGFAQSSVTINQEGERNSASINQSQPTQPPEMKSDTTNCDDISRQNSPQKNTILLKNPDSKTIYKTMGVNKNAFFINQKGSKARFYANLKALTDTIGARQAGSQNSVYLYLSRTDSLPKHPRSITLSQSGRANQINVGFCKENESANSSRNIKIPQGG